MHTLLESHDLEVHDKVGTSSGDDFLQVIQLESDPKSSYWMISYLYDKPDQENEMCLCHILLFV